jgi:hypothetical protein
VQVDPIKHTLEAPGTKLLKPKCDKLLSSLAFNFNVRRYIEACFLHRPTRTLLVTDLVLSIPQAGADTRPLHSSTWVVLGH